MEQIFYFVMEYLEFFKNGHFSLEYNVYAYYSNTTPSRRTIRAERLGVIGEGRLEKLEMEFKELNSLFEN
jgi:hypothetical protein